MTKYNEGLIRIIRGHFCKCDKRWTKYTPSARRLFSAPEGYVEILREYDSEQHGEVLHLVEVRHSNGDKFTMNRHELLHE